MEAVLALVLGVLLGHVFGQMDFGLWLQGLGLIFGLAISLIVGLELSISSGRGTGYVRSFGAVMGVISAFSVGFLVWSLGSWILSSIDYGGWSISLLNYELDPIVAIIPVASAIAGCIGGMISSNFANQGIREIACFAARRLNLQAKSHAEAAIAVWMIVTIGLSSGFYASASAAGFMGISNDRTLLRGIQVGDWAVYDVSAGWSTNAPDTVDPEAFRILLDAAWMKIEIQSKSGSIVTAKTTIHFKNGSDWTQLETADISEGTGEYGLTLIPAGLDVGDTFNITSVLYTPLGGPGVTINKTYTRVYSRANREVNFVQRALVLWIFGDYTMEFSWDRATGLFCEAHLTAAIRSFAYTLDFRVDLKMSDTNAWYGPLWFDWRILGIASLVTVVATLVIVTIANRTHSP